MSKYKLTAVGFYPEFDLLYKEIFGDAVHIESLVQGNVAYYSFDQPVTPVDISPLVKVELISQ